MQRKFMKLSEYMEELSKDLSNMSPFKLKSVIQQIKQHPDYDEHLFKPFMDDLVIDTGWLFVGSDFSALEDRIVAILSDDPMKKKPFVNCKKCTFYQPLEEKELVVK